MRNVCIRVAVHGFVTCLEKCWIVSRFQAICKTTFVYMVTFARAFWLYCTLELTWWYIKPEGKILSGACPHYYAPLCENLTSQVTMACWGLVSWGFNDLATSLTIFWSQYEFSFSGEFSCHNSISGHHIITNICTYRHCGVMWKIEWWPNLNCDAKSLKKWKNRRYLWLSARKT